MSKQRIDLQSLLESILGSRNVYFQPPTKMVYPCIMYERANAFTDKADNINYQTAMRYTLTLIGKVADNQELVEQIMSIPYCTYERSYKADNLYHDVFNLYW